MSSQQAPPASPKNVKVKEPVPGTPLFGCEHIQLLLSNSPEVMNSSIQYYKMLLRVIFDNTPIVPQTSKSPDGVIATSLTSNYLCLQCSTIVPEEDREKHGQKKSHRFYCIMQMLTREAERCFVSFVKISSGTQHLRSSGSEKSEQAARGSMKSSFPTRLRKGRRTLDTFPQTQQQLLAGRTACEVSTMLAPRATRMLFSRASCTIPCLETST